MIHYSFILIFLFSGLKSYCQDTQTILRPNDNPYKSQKMNFVPHKYHYIFQDSIYTHTDFITKAQVLNRTWQNQALHKEMIDYKRSKELQHGSAIWGLSFGVIGVLGTFMLASKNTYHWVGYYHNPKFNTYHNANEAFTHDVVIVMSLSTILTSQLISKYHQRQRLMHAKKMADIYNSHVD